MKFIKTFIIVLVIYYTATALLYEKTHATEQNIHDQTMIKYLELVKRSKYSKAYDLLSNEDRKELSKNGYITYMKEFDGYFERSRKISRTLFDFLYRDKFSYRIISSKRVNDRTQYEVEVSVTDIFKVDFEIGMLPALNDEKASKAMIEYSVIDMIKRLYPDGEAPKSKEIKDYRVMTEDGKERVWVNLKKITTKLKAQKLFEEAHNINDGDLEKSVALLEKALEIDPDNEKIKQSLSFKKQSIEKKKQMDLYLSEKISVMEQEIKDRDYYKSLYFKINNRGAKKVEIKSVSIKLFPKPRSSCGERVINLDYKLDVNPNSTVHHEQALTKEIVDNYDLSKIKVKVLKIRLY